jgi:2-polyprenyl-3-methyl-5-hydroxy-6-metoxy-1,4-benzoquinol methylase
MRFNEIWYEKIYENDKEISTINKKRYLEWLDIIEPFRKTNKIFESGFGTGDFLKTAHYERGWECAGNEISNKACEKLSFCKTYNCDISIVKDDDRYDALFSLGAIEHVNDPVSQISNYMRLLRKGGVCFLSTPNINSINRFVAGKEYRLFHPEHISYFTTKSMEKVFKMNGFSDIKIWTQNIDIYDAYNNIFSREKVSSVEVFNKNQVLREKLEVNQRLILFKSIINKVIRFLNIGLEMYVVAIKK